MDLAVDVQLAHAPRDQLRVLRAEVEDQDQVSTGGPSAARALRALRCSDAPGSTPARLPPRASVSALALGLPPFPYLLEAIVRRLLRDVDVVHVALLEPGRRDAHELGFLAQLGQGARAEVAHPGAQPAHQLLHDEGERALVRHPPLDALGHELPAELLGLLVLKVAVAAPLALAHGLERAHTAVELVGAPLVEDGLARALLGAGEEAADHDRVRPGRERLGHVARELD